MAGARDRGIRRVPRSSRIRTRAVLPPALRRGRRAAIRSGVETPASEPVAPVQAGPGITAARGGWVTRPRLEPAAPPNPDIPVCLSTSSVYPESTAAAFEIAARLGYDGVELMVFTDPVSQDPHAIKQLSEHYGIPVTSVHAPCLLVTQRVWSPDPWEKLQRARAAAELFGTNTVVVHPAFRWQREYARDFDAGLARLGEETGIHFAVENMYPWRVRSREWLAYLPDWDPRQRDYPMVTLDLSHTSVSGTDPIEMARDLGSRLGHVHLGDGTGAARDEHLIPGRGTQPCAEFLSQLASGGYRGAVVIEATTRRAATRAEREADLAEALAFSRAHLQAPSPASGHTVNL